MTETGAEPSSGEIKKAWQWLNPYCITNGSYNITRTGVGESERFTVWNVQVDPAKMEGIYLTMDEAQKAAGDS